MLLVRVEGFLNNFSEEPIDRETDLAFANRYFPKYKISTPYLVA